MESLAYLDTHVVAWLYAGRTDLFPSRVREALASKALRISPVVELELQYLFEIGRLKQPSESVLGTLGPMVGIVACDRAFSAVAREALRHQWTRDPFDRLIAAQASLGGDTLISKDATMAQHYAGVLW